MKARYRCPVCGMLLTFPGNEYGQVAAACPRCKRVTKFHYPEETEDILDELKGWAVERCPCNDDIFKKTYEAVDEKKG